MIVGRNATLESKAQELYSTFIRSFKWDQEQLDCINSNEPRVCIYGGAGTGKTLVLIAKALRLLAEAPQQKVIILTDVETNEDMLKQVLDNISKECGERDYYHALAASLEVERLKWFTNDVIFNTYISDCSTQESDDNKLKQIDWKASKQSWIEQGLQVEKRLWDYGYDHILLDEAVDCRIGQFDMLQDLVRDGGSLTIMIDGFQKLNFGDSGLPNFSAQGYTEIALKREYRSTKKIISFAKKIHKKADNIEGNVPDPTDNRVPYPVICHSREEELTKLHEYISLIGQRKSIGIITRTKEDKQAIENKLGEMVSTRYRVKTPGVYVMTVNSAKGLEFEEVIIPFVENYKNGYTALYVAVTRAMYSLVLIYDETKDSLVKNLV